MPKLIECVLHVPSEKLGELVIEFGDYLESTTKLEEHVAPQRRHTIHRSAPLTAQLARNIMSMKGKETAGKASRKSGYSKAVIARVWNGRHPALKKGNEQ